MKFAGAGLLALPVCFTAYGVIRFVGRLDGHYGPGPDWQAAHLVNLVGPPLLHVGLLALTVVLVRAGTLAWWSPALVLVGSALPIVSLDLIPVAGLCLLAALTPVARLLGRSRTPVRGAHARRVGGLPC